MITIFSGVPGSGKTSLVVDLIMDELRIGRKVFTVGIPDLMLNVSKGGDPHTWQDGSWLKIDSFDPQKAKRYINGDTQWMPRGCPDTCQFLSTCPKTVERPDKGALIVIDEAHAFFPQRASGKAPPPYVEALTVHRHQGLDFWILSQRPSFLDPFIRGLASRHIHLALNAFSFTGKRIKYEWTEYQETVNRNSKLLASKSSYSPPVHVFPLYASATAHTKLDQRMPNILKFSFIVLALFVAVCVAAFYRVQSRFDKPPSASQSPGVVVAEAAEMGGERSAPTGPTANAIASSSLPIKSKISSCIANSSRCQCYTAEGIKVFMYNQDCLNSARELNDKFLLPSDKKQNEKIAHNF